MNLNEYQALAQRTSSTRCPSDKIENGILGLCGETGECADLLKKFYYQMHDLDKEKLAEELGDVLWYVAELSAGLGVKLDEIAERNIAKLQTRYPDGFDPERSIHRPEYEHMEQTEEASQHLFEMRNRTI